MRPNLAVQPTSRYGERQYSSNKARKFKALNLNDQTHSPAQSDIHSTKNSGLPPIMPKTRSQASLNAIRNNIKDLTRGGAANGTSNVQSIIEQGRRESKQLIMMEQAPSSHLGNAKKQYNYVNNHQKNNSNEHIHDSYSQDYLNVQRQLREAYEAAQAAANLISGEGGNRVGRAQPVYNNNNRQGNHNSYDMGYAPLPYPVSHGGANVV